MNKYEVAGLIGEGAYGIVIKALNRETGEPVAIKKFKETEEDDSFKKTIIREVKLLKMLKHENIVDLKEAFKRKSRLYLVFEYVDRNLLEVIEQNPTGLPPPMIKSVIHKLVKAISFMHSHRVVHRDIKPENLLISNNGELKLCDFGFARVVDQGALMTDYVATRWYRAPELLVGDSYDQAVDMWAIGCLLCELIDSKPLFPGESDMDQIFCIQKSLGELTTEQQNALKRNKAFQGLKLPKIYRKESLIKRYSEKIDEKAIDLIMKLVQIDPKNRLNAQEALGHPFFEDVCNEKKPASTERGRMKTTNTPAVGLRKKEGIFRSEEREKVKKVIRIAEEYSYRNVSIDASRNHVFLNRRKDQRDKSKTEIQGLVTSFQKTRQ